MKKILFLALITATVMVSCNQKNNENTTNDSHMMDDNSTMMNTDSTKMMDNDSTMMSNDTEMMKNKAAVYACPMHPEVQGNLNDKCPKCGMKLTELVPENEVKSTN